MAARGHKMRAIQEGAQPLDRFFAGNGSAQP